MEPGGGGGPEGRTRSQDYLGRGWRAKRDDVIFVLVSKINFDSLGIVVCNRIYSISFSIKSGHNEKCEKNANPRYRLFTSL